jgi:hypothetical protein
MKIKHQLGPVALAVMLAACDSGDITLAPTNIDNSNQGNTITNPPTVADNPCASYEEAGQTFEGTYDGSNCIYDASFVSDTRPITVSSIRFPNFGGLHIFQDSLFVGQDVSETAANSGVPVPQEGQGTRLIIDAGNTMVFEAEDSYVRIARGSQIFAEGTAAAPITFTADEDAVSGLGTESDRGLWGGLQINGNGITNKCHDGTATGNNPGGENQLDGPGKCHQVAEGRPSTYGGNNNAENSGVLTYVVVKHAGFEVVDGDELNAITLNAVGSGTTISHVQVYTTLDDGFEMFGGAVNMDHIVAVNVGDDSIDYSEGYVGDIQYAIVLHTSGANRCIEGDNTGGGRGDGVTPRTRLRISNMTCITSNVDEGAGTNPSGKGDSEGPLFREGAFFEMYNSIVTSNATDMASNECLELDDSEGPETVDGVEALDSLASSNVIACSESLKVGAWDPDNLAFDAAAFATWLGTAPNANNVADDTNIPYTNLIDGGLGTRGYLTVDGPILDSTGAQVFDPATQLYDVEAGVGGIFETPAYLGGANAADNWLDGWTVGFDLPLNP